MSWKLLAVAFSLTEEVIMKTMLMLILMSLPSFVFGFVEVRGGIGSNAGSGDDYNKAYYNFQDGPEMSKQDTITIDAIVKIPMIPIGFGLRHEGFTEERSAFAEDMNLKAKRVSLLFNYRFIDTLFYAGAIGSYGISHDLTLAIPTDPEKITSDSAKSYSIGVEGGLKLGLFRIGAELGQQSLVFDNLKAIDGLVPNKNGLNINEIDMSGMYYKLMIGVGF